MSTRSNKCLVILGPPGTHVIGLKGGRILTVKLKTLPPACVSCKGGPMPVHITLDPDEIVSHVAYTPSLNQNVTTRILDHVPALSKDISEFNVEEAIKVN